MGKHGPHSRSIQHMNLDRSVGHRKHPTKDKIYTNQCYPDVTVSVHRASKNIGNIIKISV